MKLKPFKEIIAMGKEKLDESLAPIRAKMVNAKADLKKAEIETDLLTLEKDIAELCVDKDLDLDKLVDALDEVALLERRLKQYDDVLKQLFPKKK